jgi:uncharacterized membrane protein
MGNVQNGSISSRLGRLERLDALRGLAMVWMTVFHFCFDLANFKFTSANFYTDPFWIWQRSLIVSLFLACAGAAQAVAQANGQTWPQFWRRWAQVVACAALVTAGSAVMFPDSFIYFGVLHGIAAMLIIVRLTQAWGAWLWLAGAIVFALKGAAPSLHAAWPELAVFNTKALSAVGLISIKPRTEDYVPLIPWLGVMWWAFAATQWWLKRPAQNPLVGATPAGGSFLALLGRWSLSYYMLHQPVMIGALMLWVQIRTGKKAPRGLFLLHLRFGAKLRLVLLHFLAFQALLDLRADLFQRRHLGIAHIVQADDVVAELAFHSHVGHLAFFKLDHRV